MKRKKERNGRREEVKRWAQKKICFDGVLKPVVKDDCANHKGNRYLTMTVSYDLNTTVEPRASPLYAFNPVGGPRAESISHCHLLTRSSTTSTDRSSTRTGTQSRLPLLQRDVTSIGTCQQTSRHMTFPLHLLYMICRVCNKCMCSISTGSWMSYAQWRNSYLFCYLLT
jgi:hypothetical protein